MNCKLPGLLGISVSCIPMAGVARADLTISAVANSQYTVEQLQAMATPSSQNLQNGDFPIGANTASPSITGDGWDEPTDWTFDFTKIRITRHFRRRWPA